MTSTDHVDRPFIVLANTILVLGASSCLRRDDAASSHPVAAKTFAQNASPPQSCSFSNAENEGHAKMCVHHACVVQTLERANNRYFVEPQTRYYSRTIHKYVEHMEHIHALVRKTLAHYLRVNLHGFFHIHTDGNSLWTHKFDVHTRARG